MLTLGYSGGGGGTPVTLTRNEDGTVTARIGGASTGTLAYSIDGASWVVVEDATLPYTVPGVAAENAVQVIGVEASLDPTILYDYFVNSVGGSDANDGSPVADAFASIAAVETAATSHGAGVTIGLVGGSTWEEQFDISEDTTTVTYYGSGAAPIIDAREEITGTWTQPDSGTYANVWSISWSRVNASPTNVEKLHYWEDDAKPRLATDLADLQANGGWYCSNHFAGTATIYIKAASDPNSDGVTRLASYREHCILFAEGDNGSGAEDVTITGPLELVGAVGHYGCLAAETGTSSKLLIREGVLHHVTTAGNLEDVICTGMPQGYTGNYQVTFYVSDPTGLSYSAKRAMVIGDPSTSGDKAFYSHGSVGVWAEATFEQIAITDTGDGIDGLADECTVNGLYTKDVSCSAFIQNNIGRFSNFQINSPSQISTRSSLQAAGAVDTSVKDAIVENCVFYVDEAALAYIFSWLRNGTLVVRNCTIFWDLTAANSRRGFQFGVADTTCNVTFENNVMVVCGANQIAGEYAIRVNTGVTLASNKNIWIGNAGLVFRTASNSYISGLAAWQALGYDADSVSLAAADIATAKSTYFQGDPAAGDFRLADLSGLGTFGDGSALNNAGAQTHWDWDARAQASGAPTAWPTLPATLTDQRAYIADPTAWNFYP